MTVTINPSRLDVDEAYLQMAEIWAKRSKANRLQVGALLVKDKMIISDGYNGMPSGARDDVCETIVDPSKPIVEANLTTKRAVLHAESNCISKLAKNGSSQGAEGSTLYVTWSPCFDCSKLIIQAGISRVIYRNQYRNTDGIENLQEYDVEVTQL